MKTSNISKEQKIAKIKRKHERRIGTLKLWQQHLAALSDPKNALAINSGSSDSIDTENKAYHEVPASFEMYSVAENTIISSDNYKSIIQHFDEEDSVSSYEITIPHSNDA